MKFYIEEVMISEEKSNYFVSKGLWLGCCLLQPTTTFFSISSLGELKKEIAKANKMPVEEVELFDCYGEAKEEE